MAFYNTIRYSGDELKKAKEEAKRQAELITFIFRQNPRKKMSPSDVWKFLKHKCEFKGPMTSVRRAMTDLSSDNVLKKSEHMKFGLYGKPEHYWVLNTPFNK